MPEGLNLRKHRCDNLSFCGLIVWRPVYKGFILDKVALRGFSPSNWAFPCLDHSVSLHSHVHLSATDAW